MGGPLEAGTPLPTPWEKEPFEKRSREIQKTRRAIVAAGKPLSALDEFFREEAKEETASWSMNWSGKVGAFEGAAYEAKGLYRSSADCIMFTRDNVGFCPSAGAGSRGSSTSRAA